MDTPEKPGSLPPATETEAITNTKRALFKGAVRGAAALLGIKANLVRADSYPEPTERSLIREPDTPEAESELFPTDQEIAAFSTWADEHGIEVKGTKKPAYFWTALDYKFDDEGLPLNQMRGVTTVYKGLSRLPDEVLEVMRGKAIYLSSAPGRSTLVDNNEARGLKAGIFLAAGTTYAQAAIHEFGHLFDSWAIGASDGVNLHPQNFPQFHELLSGYYSLFPHTDALRPDSVYSDSPQPGYISSYASTNRSENFAEHFAYYVMEGNLFRAKMQEDSLLADKYSFFKEKIFGGKEY